MRKYLQTSSLAARGLRRALGGLEALGDRRCLLAGLLEEDPLLRSLGDVAAGEDVRGTCSCRKDVGGGRGDGLTEEASLPFESLRLCEDGGLPQERQGDRLLLEWLMGWKACRCEYEERPSGPYRKALGASRPAKASRSVPLEEPLAGARKGRPGLRGEPRRGADPKEDNQ